MARALKIARQRWPSEPQSTLLTRLIEAGSAALEEERDQATQERIRAIDDTSGKYSDAFDDEFLTTLRQEWPE